MSKIYRAALYMRISYADDKSKESPFTADQPTSFPVIRLRVKTFIVFSIAHPCTSIKRYKTDLWYVYLGHRALLRWYTVKASFTRNPNRRKKMKGQIRKDNWSAGVFILFTLDRFSKLFANKGISLELGPISYTLAEASQIMANISVRERAFIIIPPVILV